MKNFCHAGILIMLSALASCGALDSPAKRGAHVLKPGMFGIDVEEIPHDRITATLDALTPTGATTIRIYAFWNQIEPNPPHASQARDAWGLRTGMHTYFWDHPDKIVDEARKRGLEVYLNVIWPPGWTNGGSKTCNPYVGEDLSCGNVIVNPLWYEDFFYNLVSHFKGRVTHFGVWNEPNDRHCFNGPSDQTYLKVFMDTYALPAKRALLAADPEAKLVGPELSMGTGVPRGGRNRWLSDWMEPILRDYTDVFDIISMHNHSDRHADATDRAQKVLNLIERYAPQKEFWLTEFGASTCKLTEDEQAEQVLRIYAATARHSRWTKTFFYTFTDNDGEPCWSGLLTGFDRGSKPRKSYWQYQRLTNIAANRAKAFGLDLENIAAHRINLLLDTAKKSGATSIRIYAFWNQIEPQPPVPSHKATDGKADASQTQNTWGSRTGMHTYFWDHLDAIVNEARQRGLAVYLNVIWPPGWANGGSKTCNPYVGEDLSCGNVITNPLWYEDFFYNLVSHFKGRVTHFGVWNEPNDRHCFNGPSDSTYLRVFMETYALPAKRALQKANPEAKLVGPELSMGTGVPRGGRKRWLTDWMEPILRDYPEVFEVISMHNHSNRHADVIKRADKVGRLLHRYTPKKEFWLSEYGVDSCKLTQKEQAKQILRVYGAMAERSSWWTKTFYNMDLEQEACGAVAFGADGAEFTPRLVYKTYQDLARP